MFCGNKNIKISRSENQISFSQDFVDAVLVGDNINEEIFNKNKKTFTHTVTIINGNEYQFLDEIVDSSSGGGLLSLNLSTNVYRGNINYKGFQLGIGKDNMDGNTGFVLNEWDTESIKEPIREYMKTTSLTEKLPYLTPKRIAFIFILGWSIAIIIALVLVIILVVIE